MRLRRSNRRGISPTCCCAGILALILSAAGAFGQEKILLKVVLNEVDKGEFFLQMTADGDVLFPVEEFRQLGIHDSRRRAAIGEGAISLRSLAPDISFTVQEQTASILLTANPSLLPTQTFDFAVKGHSNVLSANNSSLFLNYTIDLIGRETALDLPLEIGARSGRLLLLSGARVTSGGSTSFVRNLTSAIIDDRASQVRVVLGDLVAGSGGLGLGSGGIFGGVSVSKNFSLNPFYVRTPDIVIRDLLPTPSTVQMYLNDMRSGSEMNLSPGVLELAHLPLMPGANTVALVVTDADGHVTRVEVPLYRSTQLLAPGVDEYSYSAGFAREGLGEESFTYGQPAFLGFHRAGFTGWLTGGLRAELSPSLASGGPTVALALGPLGEISNALAVSWSNGTFGYAGEADYSYLSKWIGASISVKYLSDDYTTFSLFTASAKPRWEGNVAIGVSSSLAGSLSAGASVALMQDGTDRETLTLSYSRPLGQSLQLAAVFTGILQEGTLQYQGSFGARLLIGDALGGVSYRGNNSSSGASADIQKSTPRGTGIGYSGSVQEAQDREGKILVDGNASFTYAGPYGVYSASAAYDHDQSQIDAELTARGSLLLIDGSFLLSQPVADSFALVEVDGIPGVRVKYANQYVGVTDSRGRAIVPGLASYNENEISIETADIPMSYQSDVTRIYVSPPYKGGGVVRFAVTRFQALTGKLYVIKEGARTPAAFAGLEVTVGSTVSSSAVGIDGAFYLEHVPAGTYHARLLLEAGEVDFDLVVPQSTLTVVDLGEIDCPAPPGK